MSASDLRLVAPSVAYETGYRGLVRDFGDEPAVPFVIGFEHDDFPAFVERLTQASLGLGLPEGWAPHSTFWLVDGGEDVLAVSNMRHQLSERLRSVGGHIGYGVRPSRRREGHATAILRLTLFEAAKLGLDRALLTCAKGNAASARTILKNGGTLDSEEFVASEGQVMQRYWVPVPTFS